MWLVGIVIVFVVLVVVGYYFFWIDNMEELSEENVREIFSLLLEGIFKEVCEVIEFVVVEVEDLLRSGLVWGWFGMVFYVYDFIFEVLICLVEVEWLDFSEYCWLYLIGMILVEMEFLKGFFVICCFIIVNLGSFDVWNWFVEFFFVSGDLEVSWLVFEIVLDMDF